MIGGFQKLGKQEQQGKLHDDRSMCLLSIAYEGFQPSHKCMTLRWDLFEVGPKPQTLHHPTVCVCGLAPTLNSSLASKSMTVMVAADND